MDIVSTSKVTAVGYTSALNAEHVLAQLDADVDLSTQPGDYSSDYYRDFKVTITIEQV